MHYMVYVLCNPARTIFFLGVTGGFTDGIFEIESLAPEGDTLWNNCNQLVHHQKFQTLEEASAYLDVLQHGINRWSFREIENRNRCWIDLSDQWINPTRLLSFQVIRNSYCCFAN